MKSILSLFFAVFCTVIAPFSQAQTQVAPFVNSHVQFSNASGAAPCNGCLLSTFSAGTTTPLATYSESTGTTPNANPLVLASDGSATIYLTNASYKFVLKTAAGATIWTQDQVTWNNLATTLSSLTLTGNATINSSTAATNVANQSGPTFGFCGNYWTGASSASDCWNINDVLGTGTNPTSTLTLVHSGSSGTPVFSVPALSASSATISGALTSKISDGIAQINASNTQAWAGSDLGGWLNAAAANRGNSGRIHVALGSYTYATQINFDLLSGLTVECDGGVTPGSAAATQFIWSGTTTPISARSSGSIIFKNCQFLWSNASFTGPYFDTSHTGTGCGGGGCDTSNFELDHVSFFKSGSGVNIPLVSLDKNVNCSIHDSGFHNFSSYAIRGAANSSSYSNVCSIVHNIANSATGDSSGAFVRNPVQSWDLENNTLELGNASGTVSFAVTDTSVPVDGFKAQANWAGDQNAATTYVLFDFSASGAGFVAGVDISGANFLALNANSTYLKLPNNSQAKFEGNIIGNCSKLLDLGTTVSVDLGAANSFTATCTTIYGTNNPVNGYGITNSQTPEIFGPVQFAATLKTASGSLSTAAVGVGQTNTGWFNNSNGRVQLTNAGTAGPAVDSANGWILGSSMGLRFGNAADPNNAGAVDSGIGRAAAGVVTVDTTATGNALGTIKAAAILSGGAAAGLTGTGACATITTQTGGSLAGRATCTGTTGASTFIITPGTTAPNGWVCAVQDETTRANLLQQTATVAASCTLTATSVTQNDVIVFTAIAF